MISKSEYNRQYREKNKEKLKQYNREWREKNKDRQRQYRIKRKKEREEANKRYDSTDNGKERRLTYRKKRVESGKAFEYHIMTKYKLSIADYNRMKDQQNNSCKICFVEFVDRRSTHIDHCHKTGAVRGLLCPRCNMLVGCIETGANLVSRAEKYIRGDL